MIDQQQYDAITMLRLRKAFGHITRLEVDNTMNMILSTDKENLIMAESILENLTKPINLTDQELEDYVSNL